MNQLNETLNPYIIHLFIRKKLSEMKKLIFNLICWMLFSTTSLLSQDLTRHEWKDRLLLIITQDFDDENYQKQISILQKDTEGLNERKLVIYRISPAEYKTGLYNESAIQSNKLYEIYQDSDKDFEVILIGLDGSIKLRQNEPINIEKLFGRIDAMPMRRNEL